jgi:hypothetical protein
MRSTNRHPFLPLALPPSRRRLLIATSVAIVALTGCGGQSSTGSTSSATAVDEPATPGASDQASTDNAPLATAVDDLVIPAATDQPSTGNTSSATAVHEPVTTESSGTPATSNSPVAAEAGDSCRLLTAAEAEAVLGMPVRDGVTMAFDSPGYGQGFDCSYSAVDQAAGPTTVHVGVLGAGFPREGWEQAQQASGMAAVEGVGDVAYFDDNNGSMDVFVDGVWLQAQLINTDEATKQAALTEICTRAIDRI